MEYVAILVLAALIGLGIALFHAAEESQLS